MSDDQHPAEQADERPLQRSQDAIDDAKHFVAERLEPTEDDQTGDDSGMPVSGGGAHAEDPAPGA